jgi:hypothetical protein
VFPRDRSPLRLVQKADWTQVEVGGAAATNFFDIFALFDHCDICM